jgi:hypothetical protein
VPWVPDTLEPVIRQAADLVEAEDVRGLAEEAGKLGPKFAEIVEKRGKWPAAAKGTLVTGGAKLAAKYLNKTGVSSEYQPEIEVAAALMAIQQGRSSLRQELKAMHAENLKAAAVERKTA